MKDRTEGLRPIGEGVTQLIREMVSHNRRDAIMFNIGEQIGYRQGWNDALDGKRQPPAPVASGEQEAA